MEQWKLRWLKIVHSVQTTTQTKWLWSKLTEKCDRFLSHLKTLLAVGVCSISVCLTHSESLQKVKFSTLGVPKMPQWDFQNIMLHFFAVSFDFALLFTYTFNTFQCWMCFMESLKAQEIVRITFALPLNIFIYFFAFTHKTLHSTAKHFLSSCLMLLSLCNSLSVQIPTVQS